jgi:hypothetical protein
MKNLKTVKFTTSWITALALATCVSADPNPRLSAAESKGIVNN